MSNKDRFSKIKLLLDYGVEEEDSPWTSIENDNFTAERIDRTEAVNHKQKKSITKWLKGIRKKPVLHEIDEDKRFEREFYRRNKLYLIKKHYGHFIAIDKKSKRVISSDENMKKVFTEAKKKSNDFVITRVGKRTWVT